jgi:hypothetical protein
VGVRDEVRRLAGRTEAPVSVAVDAADGASFPWAWYFRDLPVSYVDMAQPSAGSPPAQVLILTEGSRLRLLPELTTYEGAAFRLPRVVGQGLQRRPRARQPAPRG